MIEHFHSMKYNIIIFRIMTHQNIDTMKNIQYPHLNSFISSSNHNFWQIENANFIPVGKLLNFTVNPKGKSFIRISIHISYKN